MAQRMGLASCITRRSPIIGRIAPKKRISHRRPDQAEFFNEIRRHQPSALRRPGRLVCAKLGRPRSSCERANSFHVGHQGSDEVNLFRMDHAPLPPICFAYASRETSQQPDRCAVVPLMGSRADGSTVRL
jgi:hypothetical protein